jgi:hypothetical protein
MRGRSIPLTIDQRFVADLAYFASTVPSVAAVRRMNLSAVAAARAQSAARPRWLAIFAKAHAMVSQEIPDLRRVYLRYPHAHLYEYPHSVALIMVRRSDGASFVHFPRLIKDPASRPIAEIDRSITDAVERPIGELKEFRRHLAFARLPAPLRHLLASVAYNIGRQRPRFFGTFAVTAPPGEYVAPRFSSWTSRLSYGRLASDGGVDVTLAVDHRVIDGPTGVHALQRLEEILNGPIVDELKSGRAGASSRTAGRDT